MKKIPGPGELLIHYNRLDGNYEGWTLWVWGERPFREGFALAPSEFDEFGAVFSLDLESSGLLNAAAGFLPRYKDWQDRDGGDRVLPAAVPGELYIVEGEPSLYSSEPDTMPRILSASLEGPDRVRLVFNRPVDRAFIAGLAPVAECEGRSFRAGEAVLPDGVRCVKAVLLSFEGLGSPAARALNAGLWRVRGAGMKAVPLRLGGAVYAPVFSSDKPMGLRVKDGRTAIRVFAPFASRVEALFYDAPLSQKYTARELHPAEAGLWEADFQADTTGKYWKLRTTQNGRTFEGLDPYARCVTAHDGLALISEDRTPVAPGPVFGLSETVLYELNIRDFTIDENSGVPEKGKYLAFTRTGSVHPLHPDLLTGIDHLAELGVNAVHIMPFQDFENDEAGDRYNWGYMTVNFNSPDGWYATGLYGGERVRECKAMIDALHRKGIKVIMDVVYNHTAETKDKYFNFNPLAENYYYRVRDDGSLWNGSGCGNEFRSEAPMGRKFILDSLLHWLEEYKVDGFRFDLMGLIDLETALFLAGRLRSAKPDIILYGEPWAAGPTPVTGVSKGAQRSSGFAVFNDGFRDALKGGPFDPREKGYVQCGSGRAAVMRGIRGAVEEFTDSPLESVNYVSCHDNHTLWDRLLLSAKDEPRENLVRMDKLAQAIILTSQGIPFLHSGEEFLRTKRGEGNSYDLPDEINRIDWTLKKDNHEVFAFYRDLIAMRKAHPAFRMKTAEQACGLLHFYEEMGIELSGPEIAYQLDGAEAGDLWNRIVVLINPRRTSLQFVLPPGEYRKGFGEHGACAGGKALTGFAEVPPLSLTVVYK